MARMLVYPVMNHYTVEVVMMIFNFELKIRVDVFRVFPSLFHSLRKDPESLSGAGDDELVCLLLTVAALGVDVVVSLVDAFLYSVRRSYRH